MGRTTRHRGLPRTLVTHAYSQITRGVAANDSCFVLVTTHWHGVARLRVSPKIIHPAVYSGGELKTPKLHAMSHVTRYS